MQEILLRCDSKGDRRFSAFNAFLCKRSIEHWYQGAKRNEDGMPYQKPKGVRPVFFLLDSTYIPAETIQFEYYLMLWHAYLKKRKDLLGYAATFEQFQDIFDGHRGIVHAPSIVYPQTDRCCQAEAIAHLVFLFRHQQKKAYPKVLRGVWESLQEGE